MLNVRGAQIFASAICEPPATEFATQLLEIKHAVPLLFREFACPPQQTKMTTPSKEIHSKLHSRLYDLGIELNLTR